MILEKAKQGTGQVNQIDVILFTDYMMHQMSQEHHLVTLASWITL
jgi:hypothetical protein